MAESSLLLFTWNLNKSETALNLALDHLSSAGGDFIAAFQELPESAADRERAEKAIQASRKSTHVRCLGVVGSQKSRGRVGLFSTADLQTSEVESDAKQRMATTCVQKREGWAAGLYVVGLHAMDRRNLPAEAERLTMALGARRHIDAHWPPGAPLVLLGDFNADPYEQEICCPTGFFALRDAVDVRQDWQHPEKGTGEKIIPLYNPSWRLLPEREKDQAPNGTFFLPSINRGIRWRLVDQILISQELTDRIDGHPEILSGLCGTDLRRKVRKKRDRGGPGISDHLPLQMRVNMTRNHDQFR